MQFQEKSYKHLRKKIILSVWFGSMQKKSFLIFLKKTDIALFTYKKKNVDSLPIHVFFFSSTKIFLMQDARFVFSIFRACNI